MYRIRQDSDYSSSAERNLQDIARVTVKTPWPHAAGLPQVHVQYLSVQKGSVPRCARRYARHSFACCCCWRRVASRFITVGRVGLRVPPVRCYGDVKGCLLLSISCKQLVYKGFDFPVCYHLRNRWKQVIWGMNPMWMF